jgi:hypothetical protein
MGMKITQDRIALTNEIYKVKTAVKIQDLVDNQENVCGTQVVVSIMVF